MAAIDPPRLCRPYPPTFLSVDLREQDEHPIIATPNGLGQIVPERLADAHFLDARA